MHRFTNIPYVFNSIFIKLNQFYSTVKHNGKTPYEISTPISKEFYDFTPTFNHKYTGFAYFDYETSVHFYRKFTTHPIPKIMKALIYYSENESKKEFLTMVSEIEKMGQWIDDSFVFLMENDMGERYDLPPFYPCSVTQGKAASLFLRAYLFSKDEKYLDVCRGIMNTFFKPIAEGGIYRVVYNDLAWLEEYPDRSHPSMVLNGVVFGIIGLGEYVSTFPDDEKHRELYLSLIKSLRSVLHLYKRGRYLLYELGSWKHCNVHYYGVMTYEFQHLYEQTQIEDFKEFQQFLESNCDWKSFDMLMKLEG